jgi:predicted acyltransferase
MVFFFSSIIYLSTNWLAQIRITVLILFLYYILMTLVPVPGVGAANLEPETNLGAWIDRLLLDGHLWSQSKTWDPEGILTTLPSMGTGLMGILIGQYFSKFTSVYARTLWLFFMGISLMLAGLMWGIIFPINKALWTSSYVLYTAGIAMQLFAVCHWLIDVQGWKNWSTPFVYYGTNAIFVFVASGLLAKTLSRIKISDGEDEISSWNYAYKYFLSSWLDPTTASLAQALTLLLVFYFILKWMYKKKIFIKV